MLKTINYIIVVIFMVALLSGCAKSNSMVDKSYEQVKDMPIRASHTFKF